MTVRCKFKVFSTMTDDKGQKIVRMSPVTTGSKENDEFFKYTPFGSMEIGTINAEAAAQFEYGKEFYVDISPA